MRPRWRGGADSARSGNSCERTSERERDERLSREEGEGRSEGGGTGRGRTKDGAVARWCGARARGGEGGRKKDEGDEEGEAKGREAGRPGGKSNEDTSSYPRRCGTMARSNLHQGWTYIHRPTDRRDSLLYASHSFPPPVMRAWIIIEPAPILPVQGSSETLSISCSPRAFLRFHRSRGNGDPGVWKYS